MCDDEGLVMDTGVYIAHLFEGVPVVCGPEGTVFFARSVNFEEHHYFYVEIAMLPVEV